MRIAGHSSISISSRYVHPCEETVLNAMERLPLGGHKNRHSVEIEAMGERSGILATTTQIEGYMVSADGLEPSTHALKGHCSAS